MTPLISFIFFIKIFSFSDLISVYNGSVWTPENFALGLDCDIVHTPLKVAAFKEHVWGGNCGRGPDQGCASQNILQSNVGLTEIYRNTTL